MLEGYFDDSGTHASADVVLWGGVIGESDQFYELEAKWKRLLIEPMAGKQSITAFHAAHLSNSWNDFYDYKPAERDVVLKSFRDAIIDTKLIPVSFAISVRDWEDVWGSPKSEIFGTAEQFAFLSCVMSAARMAKISKSSVRFVFDTDRLKDSRQYIIDGMKSAMPNIEAEISFHEVRKSVGLQAADLIAYESILHALKSLGDDVPDPRPHFKRLLESAPAAYGFILRKQEIKALCTTLSAIIESGGKMTKTKPENGFENVFSSSYQRSE